MASQTWTIITALAAELANITVANGYLTDIGNNVWTTDSQRPAADATGLSIYAEAIVGAGLDHERPGKPVRELTLMIESAINADIDTAQSQVHAILEDLDRCLSAYMKAQQAAPGKQTTPMHVTAIDVLQRPEGLAVVMIQVHLTARYFR